MAETNLQVTPGAGTGVAGYTDTAGNFRQTVIIGDITNNTALIPNGVQLISSGGQSVSYAITAAKGTLTVISANPGRLCRVIVTSAGTGTATNFLTFFDNASAASGNILGLLSWTVTNGTILEFQTPAANGITCSAGGTGTPALTVTYI